MKKIILTMALAAGLTASAQVKVGSQPTTLATDANFQVESTAGFQFYIGKVNGNVGIGTTTPANRLHVFNNVATIAALFETNYVQSVIQIKNNAGSSLYIGQNTAGGILTGATGDHVIGSGSAQNIHIGQAGAIMTTFAANRNVGIGVTAPTERLQVAGNINFSGALMPNNLVGTAGQSLISSGVAGVAPTWGKIMQHKQSDSNFPLGTLIKTNLAGADGPSYTLRMTGKGYGLEPLSMMLEGYYYPIANPNIINNSGWAIGDSAPSTVISYLDTDGTISFWFDTTGYWKSYQIEVLNTTGANNNPVNHVVSVTNTALPAAPADAQDIVTTTIKKVLIAGSAAATAAQDGDAWGVTGENQASAIGRTGNVGIGTTAPLARLHLSGQGVAAQPTSLLVLNASGGAVYDGGRMDFTYASSNILNASIFAKSEGGGGGSLSFGTAPSDGAAAATAITIAKTGNVGIGTTAPTEKLEVAGKARFADSTSSNILTIDASTSATARFDTSYSSSNIAMKVGNSAVDNIFISAVGGGRVGINTNTPTSKFHVSGLVQYVDDAAAGVAGLTAGAFWVDGMGIVHSKL